MPEESEVITNEKFLDIMNYETNRTPNMSEDEYRALTEELKLDKERYANGSKEDQAVIEAKMVEKKDKMFKSEEFRKSLANDLSDTKIFGHNPTEKLAEYTPDIIGIVDGSKEVIYDDNGVPGYEMHDGWKSMSQIQDEINSRKVDQASKATIKGLIEDSMRTAETIQQGEDSTFNYQKEYNNIKQKVINNGDVRSLATDRIFGDRVFKDDLQSAIKMGTYQEMGLTDEQVQQMDPTPDGKISDEDSSAITDIILQDVNYLQDYLSEYFTKAMEQNWINNLSPAVRTSFAPQEFNLLADKAGLKSQQAVRGGSINSDGVFVRN